MQYLSIFPRVTKQYQDLLPAWLKQNRQVWHLTELFLRCSNVQLVSFIPQLAYIIKHNMDLYLDGVLPPFSTRNRFASLRGEAFHADILIKLVTRFSPSPHLRSWGRTRLRTSAKEAIRGWLRSLNQNRWFY